MSRFKTLRRTRAHRPDIYAKQDRLRPKLRLLRVQNLEARRMLSGIFSGYTTQLVSEVQSIQSTLDSALSGASALKSLPFVGQQLGAIDQAQAFIKNASTAIQTQLNTLGNDGNQSDLANALYAALGSPSNSQTPAPHGLNILGGDNGGANSSSKVSDIHFVNPLTVDTSTNPPTLDSVEVEMRLHLGFTTTVSLNLALPKMPIQITSTGGVTVTVGIDLELDVKYDHTASPALSLPMANVNHFSLGLSSSPSPSQVAFGLSVTLAGNTSLNVDVGLLQGTLKPTAGKTNSLNASVYVSSLTSPSVTLGGSANVYLTASLGLGGAVGFPNITTDISIVWPDLTQPSTVQFSYGNVQLDLGEFISNMVKPILVDLQQYTEPIENVIKVLEDPIPGLDSLPGLGNTSIMSLAGGIGNILGFGPIVSVVETVVSILGQVSSAINDFSVGTNNDVYMSFGSFPLQGSAITNTNLNDADTLLSNPASFLGNSPLSGISLDDLTSAGASALSSFNVGNAISTVASQFSLPGPAQSLLQDLAAGSAGPSSNAQINFPLFDNPSSILNLLFGKDVDLVNFGAAFHLPSTSLSFPAVSIPFLGVFTIGVNFNVTLQAAASINVGYDTYGLRELVRDIENGSVQSNPTGVIASDIGDGFFIQGPSAGLTDATGQPDPLGTYFSIGGSIGLQFAVGINVGVASLSIGPQAGVWTDSPINVSLNDAIKDSTHDGKIRLSELGSEIGSGDLFNATGDLIAGLDIVANGSVGAPPVFGFTFSDDLVPVVQKTLFNSSLVNSSATTSVPAPVITGGTGGEGPVGGGTQITIYGSNLENASVSFDYFQNGGTTPVYSDPATNISTDIPTCLVLAAPAQDSGAAASGLYTAEIVVTTPGGSSGINYNYVRAPVITSVQGQSGPVFGGTQVTIKGQHLISDATAVYFGSARGTIISKQTVSGTDVLVVDAAGDPNGGSLNAPAGVQITVATPGGTTVPGPLGSSAANPGADGFWYVPAPSITTVSPSSGPLSGGGTITIDGTDFGDASTGTPDAGMTVTFGNNPTAGGGFAEQALTDTYSPARTEGSHHYAAFWQITAAIPAAAKVPGGTLNGTVGVTLTTSLGVATYDSQNSAGLYTYAAPPTINSINPTAGPLTPFDVVDIDGIALGGATVNFGSTQITSGAPGFRDFEYDTTNNLWTIELTPPTVSTPHNVSVSVVTLGGTSNTIQYSYTSLPVVGSVSPPSGPEAGHTVVTITGTNLQNATEVSFGPFPPQNSLTNYVVTSFISDSSTQIKLYSPTQIVSGLGTLETLDIYVLTTPGSYSVLVPSATFTYTPAPIVGKVSPNFGPYEGGTTVTITGSNLANASAVTFAGVPATSFSDVNGTITAVSPAGTLSTYADVVVTAPGGISTTNSSDKFYDGLYLPVMTQAVSPSGGPATGGTKVTIVGQNFLGATHVYFSDNAHGRVPAASFHVDSPTQITAYSPAHESGEVAIIVVTPPDEESIISFPDQFTFTNVSAVTGLTATSGPVAGGTTVTINGTDLTGATEVDFNGVPATILPGSNTNPQMITVTSPASPGNAVGTVDVTVVTQYGSTPPTAADQFTYYLPGPTITALSVSSGPAAGGTAVTITGTELTYVTEVDFGGTPGTHLLHNLDGTITATSPGGTAGTTVNIVVKSGSESSTPVPADQFTYGGVATITSMSPSFGPSNDASFEVFIFGANLEGATEVDFGTHSDIHQTNKATIINDFANSMLVAPPNEAAGSVTVQVFTPNGNPVSSSQFTFIHGPIITGLAADGNQFNAPEGPAAGGTNVSIYGFYLGDATAVSFGGVPATSFTSNSDGSLTAVSPAGTGGPVNVSVTTPEGTSVVLYGGNVFSYQGVPTISSISPAAGPLAGGNSVVIYGSNLIDYALADTTVTFDGVPGTIESFDGSSATVEVPAGVALGTVDVAVTTLGGSASDPAAYTYLPPPTLTAISKSSGAFEGGTTLTITGTNLANASAVDFGPSNPATIVSNTDNQIVVTSPAAPGYSTGTVDVTVTTYDGTTAIIQPADEFTYNNAPYINGVSSSYYIGGAAGFAAGGDTVNISGNDFDGTTTVDFGPNNPATILNVSNNSIQVTTPSGNPGTVDIIVTNADGSSDASQFDRFTYAVPPTVTGVTPTSGGTTGGTLVSITGSGLAGETSVAFGNASSFHYTILNDTDNQILLDSPDNPQTGLVDVQVTTQFGTSPVNAPADHFTYMQPPQVYSQDVNSGPVTGGTQVTLTGIGLANVATVDFGSNAATIISDASGQLVVLSPASTGNATGQVAISIATQYGTDTSASFNYAPQPVLTGLTTTAGPAAGGTSVDITGSSFTGASAVDFGGVPAQSFGVFDDGTIVAVSPAGVPSTVDITVTAPGGMTETSSADQFTYEPAPVVELVTPTAGPIAGGTSVTIYGSGLAGASEVDFNDGLGDVSQGTIHSDGPNVLVVTAPSFGFASLVDIIVTTAGGPSMTSTADQYSFVPPPSVSGLSAASGFRAGGDPVSITGTNFSPGAVVDFGQTPASIIDESVTQIDVVTPPGIVGTVDVTVTAAGGISTTSSADQFTYVQPLPIVGGISPSLGAEAGGETVTITGTDLDGTSEVDFGGVASSHVSVISSTEITATVPAGTLGLVDVTVTTPGGPSTSSPADQFTGVTLPVVASISPAIGAASLPSYVTIYGNDLDGATAVDFGQAAGTIIFDGGSYLIAQSPAASAGIVHITVTTSSGTSATSAADRYTFAGTPTAIADRYAIATNGELTVDAAHGVLANDVAPQAISLTAIEVTYPANGYLIFNGDGSFSYVPFYGFNGTDSFTYEATNGYATSAPVTVSIAVSPATLTWTAGQNGNWIDSQWGMGAAYPDGTVNANVGGAGSVVNVPVNQSAYGLAVQSAAQVAVGPGAVLAVSGDTSVTDGAMLSIDPAGLFSTGGTFTLDTGGSVSGGPVVAGAYQLNDGTVSANLGGPGGVTIGSGTVTLSGTNTYAGATAVISGTLIVSSPASVPDGSDLTVGSVAAFGGLIAATSDSALEPGVINGPTVASSNAATAPVSPPSVSGTAAIAISSNASAAVAAAHDAVLQAGVSDSLADAAAASWLWAANQPQNDSAADGSDLRTIAIDRLFAQNGV